MYIASSAVGRALRGPRDLAQSGPERLLDMSRKHGKGGRIWQISTLSDTNPDLQVRLYTSTSTVVFDLLLASCCVNIIPLAPLSQVDYLCQGIPGKKGRDQGAVCSDRVLV